MRVIGGKYRGKYFNAKGFKSRPTTDKAKEGLFNILNNRYYFEDLKVLDLFSGTGCISYEFASRGSNDVTLVEMNFHHLRSINTFLKEEGINEIKTIKADVFKFLKNYQDSFDLIFADPPFDLKKITEIPDAVFSTEILKDDGLLIVEHPSDVDFSSHVRFKELRSYSAVNFSFFE